MERTELKRHESMRGWFAYELHGHMARDPRIWVVTADLGYGMFDAIKRDYPERFLNAGAAEQAALGVSVGLALEGKIPLVYSITPFLLYRPAEIIRNYVAHEEIPVKLIGSGRNQDYAHDGFSHFAGDDKAFLGLFPDIIAHWPETKENIPALLNEILYNGKPSYVNLSR